ncbi:MAG: lipoyl(octanoyl) transferase LipB [Bacteroidetes bacterium]|nr:lipoyl(octanoyl) transferase LipB [Bacteroidota bacterium]
MSQPEVQYLDWGLIDFKSAWERQEQLLQSIIERKKSDPSSNLNATPHYFILCEHPHVYTLGKSGDEKNLLANSELLDKQGATFYKINRGGDITYHGPGQLVGYPILNLDDFFHDVHQYMRYLEDVIIKSLSDFNIASERYTGLTGVWLDAEKPNARKICAMGVRLSRWVTMHGFALNVNTKLDYFSNIVPCGITDKKVTSMQQELSRQVSMDEVKHAIRKNFESVFGATLC